MASSSRLTLQQAARSIGRSQLVSTRSVHVRAVGRAVGGGKIERFGVFEGQNRQLSTSAPVAKKETKKEIKRSGKKSKTGAKPAKEVRFNFNTSLYFTEDPDPDHVNYRRVTAAELCSRREPPTRVKMLVRDFIDDSLYNPHYGYFSQNAMIFTPPSEGFDYSSMRDQVEFSERVAMRYEEEYADESDTGPGHQIWHTPTELFKPYFAQGLTSAILQSYKRNHFPDQDLIIYELGAGNGSFMLDSLKFLRDHHPDVFERTKYRIIEISPQLARKQRQVARKEGLERHVEFIESDFFKWEGGTNEPCYVIALEVFDNFAHDMVRYDLTTMEPLQAVVVIDDDNNFTLLYERLSDPLLKRCFEYRELLPPSSDTRPTVAAPLAKLPLLRKAFVELPFAPNMSKPDFIPTKATLFLERLRTQLPQHRLLVADFDVLPEAVKGRNGPVVQTRVNKVMIPCQTFLVKQGFFDIFFPTNFELLRDTYSLIMTSPPAEPETSTPRTLQSDFFSHSVRGFKRRQIGIYSQSEFVSKFGGPEIANKLKTKDGASLLDLMYKNAKIMF